MNVGIVGVGLIGGSITLALREQGHLLWLDDSRPETARALKKPRLGTVKPWQGWCSRMDLVVLAVPFPDMEGIIRKVAPRMRAGAALVELSSIKAPLVPALLEAGQRLKVASLHFMAGREVSGFANASSTLFRDCSAAAVDVGLGYPGSEVLEWWQQQLGTKPFSLWTCPQHDAAMAWISQLPYIISHTLSEVVGSEVPDWLTLAGPGFKDTARVGATAWEAVAPMINHNTAEISRGLLAFEEQLRTWREYLDGQANSAVMKERSS